jgi:hypothetical protein
LRIACVGWLDDLWHGLCDLEILTFSLFFELLSMTANKKTSAPARIAQTERFFQQLEEQILQRLRSEASSSEGRADLLRATGIHDEHLLDEFGKLGITADGLMALRLFPLVLVDQWLTKRPPGLGVDAWKRYTHEVFLTMQDVAQKRLIELTEKQMTEVAKASGGHLGFGKVSNREKAVIRQVIASMLMPAV